MSEAMWFAIGFVAATALWGAFAVDVISGYSRERATEQRRCRGCVK